MKTKICKKCAEEKPHSAFFTDHRSGKPHARCKACVNEAKRAFRRRTARCKRCYDTIYPRDEAQFNLRLCEPCSFSVQIPKLSKEGLAFGLGRPGCIVRDGVALVVDEEAETWREMPVKFCQKCGVDQHLDICLDCTSPVPWVKPLAECPKCGDYFSTNIGCPCGSKEAEENSADSDSGVDSV